MAQVRIEETPQQHCTFIAKYLSLVIGMLDTQEQVYSAWQAMRPVVVQLNAVFQEATGFTSMGRESANDIGYFPNREVLFKSPPEDWLSLMVRLVEVIDANSEVLNTIATLQGANKNCFFPQPNDIAAAARVFCERRTLINQLLAPAEEGAIGYVARHQTTASVV